MKNRDAVVILVLIASGVILPSCGVGMAGTSSTTSNPGPPVSISVAPAQTVSVPVNGVANYTATTSSTLPVVWSIGGSSLVNPGTLTYPNGTNTVQYTAPPSPPISRSASPPAPRAPSRCRLLHITPAGRRPSTVKTFPSPPRR